MAELRNRSYHAATVMKAAAGAAIAVVALFANTKLDGRSAGASATVLVLFASAIYAAVQGYRLLTLAVMTDLTVCPLEFQPSLRGEPPAKVKVAFQWPAAFDALKAPGGEGATRGNLLRMRIEADAAAALERAFESLSLSIGQGEGMPPDAEAAYRTVTMGWVDTMLWDSMRRIVESSQVGYLRYDCQRIAIPGKSPEPPPDIPDRIIFGRSA